MNSVLRRLIHEQCTQRRKKSLLCLFVTVFGFLFGHELYWQWQRDASCILEAQHTTKSRLIEGDNKDELVRQFLNIYDVNLPEARTNNLGSLAEHWMTCRQVHGDSEPNLGSVLKWLSTARITKVLSGVDGRLHGDDYTGTTAKFQVFFEGGYKALFKMKRYERTAISGNFTTHILGSERHNGEVASYHLQRLLGFNRAPITVGRKIHLSKEILPVADRHITDNIVVKESGEMCIAQTTKRGIASKAKVNVICTENGLIEGALMLWLPHPLRIVPALPYPEMLEEKHLMYPLSYDVTKLLDYAETTLFDYLIQNFDRGIMLFEPSIFSSIVLLDNGKSFGNPYVDEGISLDIFVKRCQLRKSTFVRLKQLEGGVLSTVLRRILSRDPIDPVLWELHYEALDRRLKKILSSIDTCIQQHGYDKVLVEDELPTEGKIVYASTTMWTHFRWWQALSNGLWFLKMLVYQ